MYSDGMARQRPEIKSKQASLGVLGGSGSDKVSQSVRRTLASDEADGIRMHPPPIMVAREAAAYVRLSERTFRQEAQHGVFPSIRVGRRLMFRRDSIDAALKRLEAKPR
jgi:excisionase family DNA binding protein